MSDIAPLAPPPPAPAKIGPADAKLRAAVEDFEAMFIAQMLEHMRTGLTADGPTGGGNGERAWQSVLNNEYGKTVAKRNGIGIADMLYRQMLQLQEGER